MKRLHLLASLPLSLLGLVSIPANVHAAADCTSDAECQPGYVCNVTAVGGCTAPACAKDAECPAPPPCTTLEIRQCSPGAACASDSDCSPELRCVAHAMTSCSGVAPKCAAGQDCVSIPPPECTTTTVSTCQPRYGSACSAAAECGPGLQCVPSQRCTCAGGGMGGGWGVDPVDADGGVVDPDGGRIVAVPLACACTNDGPTFCNLAQKDCAQPGDCPSGWTCEDVGAGGCAVSSKDADAGCPAPPTVRQCISPFGWNVAVPATGTGQAGGTGGSILTVGKEGNSGGSLDPDGGAGASADPDGGAGGSVKVDPGKDPGGPAVRDAGASNSNPSAPGTQTGDKGGSLNHSNDGQGKTPAGSIDLGGGISCQVGSAPSGALGSFWLAAVGIASLITRRRRLHTS